MLKSKIAILPVSLVSLLVLNACGGGGGNADTTPPSAEISFPPPYSTTDGQTITVRGTANDESGITSVTVNGVAASTTNDFADWSAEISLNFGDNQIEVATVDDNNNTDSSAASILIEYKKPLLDAVAIAMDNANNRALIIDNTRNAILALNLSTNEISNFSSNNFPDNNNQFEYIEDITIDTANNRALVIDSNINTLFAVDLDTGARSILSNDFIPNDNNTFSQPTSIAIDASVIPPRALVVSRRIFNPTLYAVNLDSGDRTILSDNNTPNTSNQFDRPESIAIDYSTSPARALIVDRDLDSIIAVNLSTGERSLFSTNTIPNTDNTFSNPTSIVIEEDNSRALVSDSSNDSIIAIALSDGSRTILSDDNIPNNVNTFFNPQSLAIDTVSTTNKLLVIDNSLKNIFTVDLSDGSREKLLNNAFPENNITFEYLEGISFDGQNNRLLVTDSYENKIYAIDLATAQPTIFSDNTTPDNLNEFNYPTILKTDEDNNRLYVIDSDRLMQVDLSNGSREILSSETVPDSSIPWDSLRDISLNTENNTIFALTYNNTIYKVDTDSGSKEILSSNTFPNTINPYKDINRIAYDSVSNSIFIAESYTTELFSFDIDSTEKVKVLDYNYSWSLNDLVLDKNNNRLFLTISDYSNILNNFSTFNISSGELETLSDGASYSFYNLPNDHNLIESPWRSAIHEDFGFAVAIDEYTNKIYAIDLVDGQRVILSRPEEE